MLRSVQGSAPWPGLGLPPRAAMLVHWGRVGALGSRCPARRTQTTQHRGPGLCFLLQGRVRPPRSCCAAAGAGTREHFSNPAFGCSPWVWGRVVNVRDACRWVGARAAGAPPPSREAAPRGCAHPGGLAGRLGVHGGVPGGAPTHGVPQGALPPRMPCAYSGALLDPHAWGDPIHPKGTLGTPTNPPGPRDLHC